MYIWIFFFNVRHNLTFNVLKNGKNILLTFCKQKKKTYNSN